MMLNKRRICLNVEWNHYNLTPTSEFKVKTQAPEISWNGTHVLEIKFAAVAHIRREKFLFCHFEAVT